MKRRKSRQVKAAETLDQTVTVCVPHGFHLKFGAVLPGTGAAGRFDQLLQVCEAEAHSKGLSHLVAGVNLGREEAYRQLFASGFRADSIGIVMERPNESGYNHSGVYLIDDWR